MRHLERINSHNVWDAADLKVREDQADFVAPNEASLIEAYLTLEAGGQVLPFGVFDGDAPVGFVTLSYGVCDAWENPPALAHDS